MNFVDDALVTWMIFVARQCLAVVFLVSGIHKAFWYGKAEAEFRRAAVPAIQVLLPLTILLHVTGALGLMTGLFAREAALALAAFTLIVTVKVHCFWRMSGNERLDRSRDAMANLAIVGGLILLAAVGPGSIVL